MPHWYQYIPSLIQFCFGFAPQPWIYNALMVEHLEKDWKIEWHSMTYLHTSIYNHIYILGTCEVQLFLCWKKSTEIPLHISSQAFEVSVSQKLQWYAPVGRMGMRMKILIPCCDWVQPLFSPQVIWVIILWWGAKAVDPNPVFNSSSNLCANRRELCIAWMASHVLWVLVLSAFSARCMALRPETMVDHNVRDPAWPCQQWQWHCCCKRIGVGVLSDYQNKGRINGAGHANISGARTRRRILLSVQWRVICLALRPVSEALLS